MLTVSRAVVQVHPKVHPDNGRFLVKPYPKDKEYRRFKVSAQITAKLKAHAAERGPGPRRSAVPGTRGGRAAGARVPRLSAGPGAPLDRTKPNAAGHRYRHGTLTGYSLGRWGGLAGGDAACNIGKAGPASGLLNTAGEQPQEQPLGVQAEQVSHLVGETSGICCQALVAVEHVLEHVVGGITGIRLGIDDQPWLPLSGQHVARVQVGAQHHVALGSGGQLAE